MEGKDYDDEYEGKKEVRSFDWMPSGCESLADGKKIDFGIDAVRILTFPL